MGGGWCHRASVGRKEGRKQWQAFSDNDDMMTTVRGASAIDLTKHLGEREGPSPTYLARQIGILVVLSWLALDVPENGIIKTNENPNVKRTSDFCGGGVSSRADERSKLNLYFRLKFTAIACPMQGKMVLHTTSINLLP